VIVRDAHLINAEVFDGRTDLPYSEVKTEVVIDRITSKASPRQMERVPAGAVFEMNIVLNIFEGDPNGDTFTEEQLLKNLFKAMRLVEDDYMGGSGSRGYGQVKFKVTSAKGRTTQFYMEMGGDGDDLSDKIPDDLK
jgi:CRISPR-associated protein Csm3